MHYCTTIIQESYFLNIRIHIHHFDKHKVALTKAMNVPRCILIAHACIAAAVVATPFAINDANILRVYIIFCLAIYVHWALNDNLCVLTLMEMRARGMTNRGQSLVHRVIEPFFTKSESASVHAAESLALLALVCLAAYKVLARPE